MTNKKFKIAAMSVALTACVAAQPLIANAADEVENTPDLPGDDSTQNTDGTSAQSSSSSMETNINQEEKDSKEAFGDNVEVKYDPTTEVKDPATGSSTIDGTIEKTDPDGKDETGDGETDGKEESEEKEETGDGEKSEEKEEIPDGEKTVEDEKTEEKEETSEGEKTEGKDESFEGSATKTETPESTKTDPPVPNPGAEPQPDPSRESTTEEKPDGTTTVTNPTVTEGTQTTTTTGSGTASGTTTDTKKETFDKGEFNLEKELGGKPDIDWDKVTENPGDYSDVGNGYKVSDVQTEDDRQTLTLTKTETSEGTMTSDDIAKLVDAEKTDLGDGSYVLKRTEEVKDESGKVVSTRTTYITVKEGDSHVSISTTTTLTVTREREQHSGTETVSNDFKVPEIMVTDKENPDNKKTISSEKLNDLIQNHPGETTSDGKTIYNVIEEDDKGVKREYTITVDSTASKLSAAEIAEKLGDGFMAEGNDVYYIDANGNRSKLSVEQTDKIRETLSYTVSMTETKKAENATIEGKAEAEAKAKDEAVRNALKASVDKMLADGSISEAEANSLKNAIASAAIDAERDDTFKYTVDGRTFTLDYKAGTITGSNSTDLPDTDTTVDNKNTTVTGTSYVTTGKVEWSKGGTLNGEYRDSDSTGTEFVRPDEKYLTSTEPVEGGAVKKTYTVVSEDGKTTTVYEVTESDVTLSDAEKEALAWEKLLESHPGKSKQDLIDAGFTITSVDFDTVKRVDWKITETVTGTDEKAETIDKTLTASGSKDWSIDENAGTITVNGKTYRNVTKNNDGTYTCTDETDDKITYTFTVGRDSKLDDGKIIEALAKEFNVSADEITLNDDGSTASFKQGNSTITVDYSSMKKTINVRKDVHSSASITTRVENQADLDAAYADLWEQIQEKRKTLQPGETLYIGDLEITDQVKKDDIIKYITKAISPEDMSKDEIIKALLEQEKIAMETDVTVNKGTNWEEVLKNYYSGSSDMNHSYSKDKKSKGDYIGHLELASDSKLDLLPEEDGTIKTSDCVLIRDGLTLKWNYDATDLIKNGNGQTVGLKNTISYDSPGKHYEYARVNDRDNNNPTKSAFYKVTGTVVYDAVKENGEVKKFYDYNEAKRAYCQKTGLSWRDVSDDDYAKYIVRVGNAYQVYTKSSELEAYGYMSRDANTCANGTAYRQNGKNDYVGGFDLKISKLTQVREGKIVGQTTSTVKTIVAPLSVRSSEDFTKGSLRLNNKLTSTPKSDTKDLGSGYNQSADFTGSYEQALEDNFEWTKDETRGEGQGTYKSFLELIRNTFTGSAENVQKDDGSFSYSYTTETDLNAETKETVTVKNADVKYTYTTIETSDVLIPGEEIVEITPERPDDPSDDENTPDTPDSPVLPTNPELPPVQDARPDEITETAVLPTNPVLPPVQDARMDAALPQTGVNWLTAIGLALSGVTLMAAGAFTTLTGKGKKEQH